MLEFKKISPDTQQAMEEAVVSDKKYYEPACERICGLLGGGKIHILNSANSCLLVVAEAVEDPVLVADQGGWNGFIRSCEIFGKEIEYFPTDDGLVNIEKLSSHIEKSEAKSLYVTGLAGYTARQPLDVIEKLCNIHEVTLIVDISGNVGDEKTNHYGDIQISSTGSPKIINIENGGFINNKTGKIELNKHLLKSLKADNITCAGIENETGKAIQIEEKTMLNNQYLKRQLTEKLENHPDYAVIHPENEGLNTIITSPSKSKAKKLAYNIRQKLETTGNIITTGPNYNRIKRPSITIETKNLDMNSLNKENMDYIIQVITEEIEKIQ